jgi:hypothetical protein
MAIILTNSGSRTFFPGNVAGTEASGGQCDTDVMVSASGGYGRFYGTTPIAQPSSYTQTYSTTASKTNPNMTASNPPAGGIGATVGAYNTATHRDAMITSLTNVIADVTDLKKLVNSVIDDLQALGLFQ